VGHGAHSAAAFVLEGDARATSAAAPAFLAAVAAAASRV